ncbi:MAG: DUF1295 domain-containing protein [Acidobacteriota bacterium]|nr:MAG: DUF1295 domain-containing protein [Acidobacteriota bacterium]
MFVAAPYGRHTRPGWGPTIPAAVGWVLMELPAVVAFAVFYALGDRQTGWAYLAFLGLWQLHYLHRTFVYPLRRRGSGKRMPVVITLLALAFNCVNAYLNARYLFALGPAYSHDWARDPRFIAGVALFLLGLLVNVRSDDTLLRLRRSGQDYAVARSGLFRLVSCPNYLGEIVEWCGWAMLTWSWPGLAFALWTAANLVPRALSHHRWYRQRFADYPPERKALIPFVL